MFNILSNIFKSKQKALPVSIVADRFRQLFLDHGISSTQIPRVFSEISLEDLQSNESLIKILTPNLIEKVANFFDVKSEWIEGVEDTISNPVNCYKSPEEFFKYFNQINHDSDLLPLRTITSVDVLDYQNENVQPIVLILLEKIFDLNDEQIYRYKIIDGEWNWAHEPCRIQIKSMVRVLHQKYGMVIPLFKVDQSTVEDIANRQLKPKEYVSRGLITNPSLEDYALSNGESRVAKEAEELPKVQMYIELHNLLGIAKNEPVISATQTIEPDHAKIGDGHKAISEMNSNNAKQRYTVLNTIKKAYINFHQTNKYKSRKQSARLFFDSLGEKERIQLVPTYDAKDMEQSKDKAVRTLTTALRDFLNESTKLF